MTEYICKECGNLTIPKQQTKGSLLIEIILWFFFLLPGLIYSIWRLGSRYLGCEHCGSTAIVPTNSMIGKQLLEKVTKENPEMAVDYQKKYAYLEKRQKVKSTLILTLIILVIILVMMASNTK